MRQSTKNDQQTGASAGIVIYTDRGYCLCDLTSEFQTDGTENVADQAILRSYHRGQAGS